jgi:hypothetical protein
VSTVGRLRVQERALAGEAIEQIAALLRLETGKG